jgi:hypothetical protein
MVSLVQSTNAATKLSYSISDVPAKPKYPADIDATAADTNMTQQQSSYLGGSGLATRISIE